MTYTDSAISKGEKGAKRTSFQPRNYRDLALRILTANPDAEVEDIVDEFVERLLQDKDSLRSLAVYGLQNVKTALHPVRVVRSELPSQLTIEKQILEQQATEITKKITSNLLQFIMPSGKTLAQSTGAECNKIGGWFKTIGRKVGHQGIVGQKLTEGDLQKLFKESQRTTKR
jgi:hypothetical protein